MTIKAVFHIDEIKRWGVLLRNLSNLLKETGGEGQQAEVVANGDAVRFYTEAGGDDAIAMKELSGVVRFTACSNSLKRLGLSPASLPSFVEVVPVGVLELIIKQHEGFAYVKP